MAEGCHACRFWRKDQQIDALMQSDGSDAHGWCRRFPPAILDHMARMTIPHLGNSKCNYDPENVADVINVHSATLYPATFGDEWCGEFQRVGVQHG